MDIVTENKFETFDLSQDLISKLTEKNITEPTAVQQKVIPVITQGQSVIFESETGTGKTLAFLLPLLNKISENEHVIKSLILSPTYELASQIKTEVQSVSKNKCCLFIGTSPIKRQIELLKEKPVIAVGGSSRILELIRLKKLKTLDITSVVLDEVDRLLSPELRDDTISVLSLLPDNVQIIACSATIPQKTAQIIMTSRQDNKKFSSDLQFIQLPPEDVLRHRIQHWAFYAEERDKTDLLRRLLVAEKPEKTLIFTSKVSQVEQITSRLQHKNIDCLSMSAKAEKQERKAAIDKFKSGKCAILVTSDLGARGLDIQGITHVIQMDFPSNTDFFIHRCGRTGRAGKKGINIVIGDAYEMRKYSDLEKKLGIIVYPKDLFGGKVVSPTGEK